MGGNKPFHPFEGGTLIEATIARIAPQVQALAINTGRAGTSLAEQLRQLPFLAICDEEPLGNLGPLSGVLCALEWARACGDEAVITIPCDMPCLPGDLVAQLETNAETIDVVIFSGTKDYPLCALWKTSVAPALRTALNAAKPQSGLPVMRFLETQRVCKIKVEDDTAFANINTPDALF